jgi:uncharacterized protein (UPF0264 family)
VTRFLASVRNAPEAAIAVAGGADIVDFKEPDDGALGAVDVDAIAAGLRVVAGRAETSATCGDLPLDAARLVEAATRIAATGVDYVKLGLMPGEALNPCIDALAGVAQGHRLIAVFFADLGVPRQAFTRLAAAGFSGVLVDTFHKDGRGLRQHLAPESLKAIVADSRGNGLMVGLAGALRLEDIEPLRSLGADLLGFRSALCAAQARRDEIRADRVARVRAAFDASAVAPLTAAETGQAVLRD